MRLCLLCLGLKAAAAGQAVVALVNLGLVPLLNWRQELQRMPTLLREVFQVHKVFISVTLACFAAWTWRFADAFAAGDPMGRWICGGIGIFWLLRAVAQVACYSPAHWRGQAGRTAIHLLLLAVYSGWALLYLAAAWTGSEAGR
jgi:hypothetical protein